MPAVLACGNLPAIAARRGPQMTCNGKPALFRSEDPLGFPRREVQVWGSHFPPVFCLSSSSLCLTIFPLRVPGVGAIIGRGGDLCHSSAVGSARKFSKVLSQPISLGGGPAPLPQRVLPGWVGQVGTPGLKMKVMPK